MGTATTSRHPRLALWAMCASTGLLAAGWALGALALLVSRPPGTLDGKLPGWSRLVVLGYLAVLCIGVPAAQYSSRAVDRGAPDTRGARVARLLVGLAVLSFFVVTPVYVVAVSWHP